MGVALMLLESSRETGGEASFATGLAKSGRGLDPGRFAAVVTRYQSRVHRLVASILGPAYSAETDDATQEVFLHAYRKLESFRGDSRFSTWLYRLAYNRAIDYRRRLTKRPDLQPAVAVDGAEARSSPTDFSAGGLRRPQGPLSRTLARERADQLRRHLDHLSQPQRTAVHLHYWLGCSIAEIAELTDSNPTTVKSHLFRARQALARRLKKD